MEILGYNAMPLVLTATGSKRWVINLKIDGDAKTFEGKNVSLESFYVVERGADTTAEGLLVTVDQRQDIASGASRIVDVINNVLGAPGMWGGAPALEPTILALLYASSQYPPAAVLASWRRHVALLCGPGPEDLAAKCAGDLSRMVEVLRAFVDAWHVGAAASSHAGTTGSHPDPSVDGS